MFYIQAPAPALRRPATTTYVSIGSAIAGVIERFTEEMYWVWNGVPVRVGYVEPFSVVLGTPLGLIEACLADDHGAGTYGFREEELIAHWSVVWANGGIRIDAVWHGAPGGVEPLLQQRPSIAMPLDEFLAEWKMPFRRILDALDRSGATVGEDEDRLARLRAVEAAIPQFGWLYRDGG
jgi:hypothetical protein